ncbi:hypothetical protein GUJ93_ZPchr0004g40292 [Zizania palustris]|uniref:Uncharacterized protein n=1 Tax=Zizania palustris TaxID=103762 RepID=A0A8J5VG85_ZIZPA|nr:hypothetical protein GUJ93_ZPchr0004g40292 [Zizania palustris]
MTPRRWLIQQAQHKACYRAHHTPSRGMCRCCSQRSTRDHQDRGCRR